MKVFFIKYKDRDFDSNLWRKNGYSKVFFIRLIEIYIECLRLVDICIFIFFSCYLFINGFLCLCLNLFIKLYF